MTLTSYSSAVRPRVACAQGTPALDQGRRWWPPPARGEAAPSSYGARVPLVDDETDLVDLVTRVLADDGHVVEHAQNEAAAPRYH